MRHHSLGLDYASQDENRVPDFGKAYAAGIRFAFLRGSVGTWHDPTPARDRAAIRAAGIIFGAYLAPKIAAGAPSPVEQVAAFAAASGLQRGVDMAPAIDVEFSYGVGATRMTILQIATWLGELVAAARATFGCNPIVYTSARVLEDSDTDTLRGAADAVFDDCPLWLTGYVNTNVPQFERAALGGIAPPHVPPFVDADGWWIHQYQGDAHGVPAIAQADLDRFNMATATTGGTRRAWMLRRLGAATSATNDQLEAAIRSFQSTRQLTVDGIVGPATFAALSWNY